jgi:hypothetical protein
MKRFFKTMLAGTVLVALLFNFNANAQVWNIPPVSTSTPTYFGVTGGTTNIGLGYEALTTPRLVVQNKFAMDPICGTSPGCNVGTTASFLINNASSTSTSIVPQYRVNILDRYPNVVGGGNGYFNACGWTGTAWQSVFSIDFNGGVVIGDKSVITLPGDRSGQYKLGVQGGIITEKVKIALHTDATNWSWPDYVFKKDYKLLPLNELESFINKNKHLPGIPSESEVKKDGLDVAEMDASLLKKVEELTLYLIEIKKENEVFRKALETQNKKIKALEASK